jgi:hypothetical protein
MDGDKHVIDEIKAKALDLKTAYTERDAQYEMYDEMFFMTWSTRNATELAGKARIIQSPDARNAVMGAVRLMIATDPLFNVADEVEGVNRDKIERWATGMWDACGRIYGEPIHYGLITSGMLYDEMHAAITPTLEMVEYARRKLDECKDERQKKYLAAQLDQAEDVAERTPFLIEAWNPRSAYTEFGRLGNIVSYYKEEEMPVAEIRARYGYVDESKLPKAGTVVLCVYYDEVYTAAWVRNGCDLMMEEHGYGFVPVYVQVLNGTRLFAKPEKSRQPLLYGQMKSGLWDSESLALTTMYSNVLAMAGQNKYVYIPAVQGSDVEIDYRADVTRLNPGDQLVPLDFRNLIPPALAEMYQLAVSKGQESTIYQQALGGMSERNTTYSEAALYAQAGRLPLVGPQRRGGWGIGGVIELAMRMARNNPEYLKRSNIKATDIPRGLHIDAKLEVKLPQEKLAQANIGAILMNNGVSFDFVAQNVLGINRPEEETRKKWNEQAAQIMYQQQVQALMQQAQAKAQQAQIAQQQQAQPQPQAGPGQPQPGQRPPQGNPMQAGPMMGQGQAQRIQGGLPPQQAGMMPGEGEASVPPEMANG